MFNFGNRKTSQELKANFKINLDCQSNISASMSTKRSIYSSSSKTPRQGYDVFLSFRGEDVRGNFLEYLYRALRQKGILTFKDDDKLQDGENIKGGLVEAIEQSRFSVVVLSKNYANSSWCLDELVHILQCKKTLDHVVYPVFYHVKPCQVRQIKGEFGEGFARTAFQNESKVQKWIAALEEVANLKGMAYPSTRFENEANLIDNLVRKIFSKSIDAYPYPSEGLVGIRYRMEQVIKLLNLGSDETRVIGLWGMGGIGKTTLAKAVYDSISWQFECCSFIDNVREVLNRSGVSALQKHLISDILYDSDFKVRSVMRGTSVIEKVVFGKKVLIVLDDVSDAKELENLVGDLHRFSHGSRIIITTRNRHVLTVCGVQDSNIFKVQELNKDEAIELFKSKAFAKNGETGEFEKLIGRAIEYAKGVPLALKVLGSFLLGGNLSEWECALNRLRESPDDELQRVLRISYDGLHWTEKEIFLDICCFFKEEDKDRVVAILDSCGFNAVTGINVLVKKCLLTFSKYKNVLSMHDLIQKMGWSIVDEESRKEPGERSRIWRRDDVKHVLMENTGTKKVEGISILYPEDIQPRPNAFAKMTGLRFLKIRGEWCPIDLPNKLRCLYWDGYPMRYMTSTFQPEHLVKLLLTNSRIEQLWDRTMVLPKLTLLDLRYAKFLTKGPELTGFPNLEYLIFQSCTALVDLHPSIKHLKKLKRIDLSYCSSLQTVPQGTESQCLQWVIFSGCLKLHNILDSFGDSISRLYLDGTGITVLPQHIGNSTNLEYLDLSGCEKLKIIPSSIGQLRKLKELNLMGCTSLNELPEEVGFIDNLEILNISFSGVQQLPASVARLRNLQTLVCTGCEATPLSFTGLESLTTLILTRCRLAYLAESISFCLSLKTLYISNNDFEYLPSSMRNLIRLESLWMIDCKNLLELPELPSSCRSVKAAGCESLKTICSPTVLTDARVLDFGGCPKLDQTKEIDILLGYEFLFNQIKENRHRLNEYRQYSGPGSKLPEWVSYKNFGPSVTLHLPLQNFNASNFLGFAFSAVVATSGHYYWMRVQMRIGGKIFDFGHCMFPPYSENVINLYLPMEYFKVEEFRTGGTDIEVCFVEAEDPPNEIGAPEVTECGARLIYDEEFTAFDKLKGTTELS